MGRLTDIAEIRQAVLAALASPAGGYAIGNLKHTLVQSDDHNRFMVVRTGWFRDKDYYGVMQDVELRDGQVIINRDSPEESLVEALLEAGVESSTIIRAYAPAEAHSLTR